MAKGKTAEQIALEQYLASGKKFTDGGAAKYSKGENIDWSKLGAAQDQGPSGYNDIKTDPAYKAHEMEALRQLEEQSKDGYSARDRADLARVEQNASRANAGRQGAIDQQIQDRGLSGSGLEFSLKQQSAQASAEQEALSSLEKNAQMQERKQAGAARLGELSSQMQNRDFGQQAQAKEAQDSINRFNTSNANQTAQYNNTGVNNANQDNVHRANQTSDNNTQADYGFRKDTLGVNQGNAKVQFDYAASQREAAEKRARDRVAKNKANNAFAGSMVGGVAGSFFGPAGTAAGSQLGGQIGGQFAHGGKVGGPEITHGDDEMNDVISAMLSPGEIVIPKSHATPKKAAAFVAEVNGSDDSSDDVVSALLEALSHLNKKGK